MTYDGGAQLAVEVADALAGHRQPCPVAAGDGLPDRTHAAEIAPGHASGSPSGSPAAKETVPTTR